MALTDKPDYLSLDELSGVADVRQLQLDIERYAQLPAVNIALTAMASVNARYRYHNQKHTVSVVWYVTLLGLVDSLSAPEREINALAACFHDVGFSPIEGGGSEKDHERVGVHFVRSLLPSQGYPERIVEEIVSRILDTALVPTTQGYQQARSDLRLVISGHLLDADVHNLGTTGFFDHLVRLYNERNSENVSTIEELLGSGKGREHLQASLRFLEGHRWQTQAGLTVLEEGKRKNVVALSAILA